MIQQEQQYVEDNGWFLMWRFVLTDFAIISPSPSLNPNLRGCSWYHQCHFQCHISPDSFSLSTSTSSRQLCIFLSNLTFPSPLFQSLNTKAKTICPCKRTLNTKSWRNSHPSRTYMFTPKRSIAELSGGYRLNHFTSLGKSQWSWFCIQASIESGTKSKLSGETMQCFITCCHKHQPTWNGWSEDEGWCNF